MENLSNIYTDKKVDIKQTCLETIFEENTTGRSLRNTTGFSIGKYASKRLISFNEYTPDKEKKADRARKINILYKGRKKPKRTKLTYQQEIYLAELIENNFNVSSHSPSLSKENIIPICNQKEQTFNLPVSSLNKFSDLINLTEKVQPEKSSPSKKHKNRNLFKGSPSIDNFIGDEEMTKLGIPLEIQLEIAEADAIYGDHPFTTAPSSIKNKRRRESKTKSNVRRSCRLQVQNSQENGGEREKEKDTLGSCYQEEEIFIKATNKQYSLNVKRKRK